MKLVLETISNNYKDYILERIKYRFIYFSKIKLIKTIDYVVKIAQNLWTGTYNETDFKIRVETKSIEKSSVHNGEE